ncbi:glycosyltransferase family 2 protein [Candidatus Saccharibacteria bacterium]|nr:glycosyltransferase family 2 protein [Candidatus Saccharibacteria bacterium]
MIDGILHNISLGVIGAGIFGAAAAILGSSVYDVSYSLKRRSLARLKPGLGAKKRPLITTIVYSYKQPEQTLECLAGLVKSTHRKIQIIVVDNASKDNTKASVKQFMANHPKKDIKLISKYQHSPLPEAIKTALKAARGDLVLILEPNHIVERQALQLAANYLAQNGVEALMPAVVLSQQPSLLNLWARYKNFASLSKQKTLSLLSDQGRSFKFGIFYRSQLLKHKKMELSGVYTSDVTIYYDRIPGIAKPGLDYYRLVSKRSDSGPNPLLELFKLMKLASKVLILPMFLWYSAYLALNSKYPDLLVISWGVFTFFMIIAAWAVEQLNLVQKIKYTALAPAMFSLFFVMSYIESVGILLNLVIRFAIVVKRKTALSLPLLKQRQLPAKAS